MNSKTDARTFAGPAEPVKDVSEVVAEQIAADVEARKKDVTIPVGERGLQTEKNNVPTFVPTTKPKP